MDIRKLYRRWQRLGTPSKGLTARAVVGMAKERDYRPRPPESQESPPCQSPWYDYDRQAWVRDGKYVSCSHSDEMGCQCYGKVHAGELAP